LAETGVDVVQFFLEEREICRRQTADADSQACVTPIPCPTDVLKSQHEHNKLADIYRVLNVAQLCIFTSTMDWSL